MNDSGTLCDSKRPPTRSATILILNNNLPVIIDKNTTTFYTMPMYTMYPSALPRHPWVTCK